MDPGTAMILASTAMQAGSALMEGKAGYANEKMAAAILAQNAARARQEGKRARAEAREAEEAQRRQAALELGAASAALAQAGGGMNGTAARLIVQQARLAELDALNIRYGGEMENYAAQAEASGLEFESRMAKKRAQQAAWGGAFGAATALLSGGAKYAGYRQNQAVLTAQRTAMAPRKPYAAAGAKYSAKKAVIG